MTMKTKYPLKPYFKLFLWLGIFLFFFPALWGTFMLMPFPGSQEQDTLATAYALHPWIFPTRIIGLFLMIGPIMNLLFNGRWGKKTAGIILVLLIGAMIWFTEFFAKAEIMFKEPTQLIFKTAAANEVPEETLIMGIYEEGLARAYPVPFLSYHHKIQDTLNQPFALVTYCSVCRSGRVFSPVLNGEYLHFRLVGMRQFNALFEDERTKSWWHQASGEVVAGSRKGEALEEILSEQMTLKEWMKKYPETLILQEDPAFAATYRNYYAYYKEKNSRKKEGNWSWVLGVEIGNSSKAYSWSLLQEEKIINDRIGETSVLLVLEKDSLSFHVLERELGGRVFEFQLDSLGENLQDQQTHSLWKRSGLCISGELKGSQLSTLQAYQEYEHSWKTFHPNTEEWKKEK